MTTLTDMASPYVLRRLAPVHRGREKRRVHAVAVLLHDLEDPQDHVVGQEVGAKAEFEEARVVGVVEVLVHLGARVVDAGDRHART
jgi:hypothetical protein